MMADSIMVSGKIVYPLPLSDDDAPPCRNKFCFTGGLVEGKFHFIVLVFAPSHLYYLLAAVQLPGSSDKA
jgi:hypothetical protein